MCDSHVDLQLGIVLSMPHMLQRLAELFDDLSIRVDRSWACFVAKPLEIP